MTPHRSSFARGSRCRVSSLAGLALLCVLTCGLAVAVRSASAGESRAGRITRALPGLAYADQQQKPQTQTDPQVKAILDQLAGAGVLHPRTLDQVRAAYSLYAEFAGTPENVFRVEDRTIPGPAGEIGVRLYVPRAGGGLPVWVFFHGGGFVTGSLDTHDAPLRAVANRCDCLIVSVAYRLAPENRYPAAPNDAYAATQWVAAHAAEIGGDPARIAVGGDGAGGNLAAVVALMSRNHVDSLLLDSKVRGKTDARPALGSGLHLTYQVLIYPTVDLSLLTNSWILSHDPVFTTDSMSLMTSMYVPMLVNPQEPYLSPTNASSLRGLPPTFLVTDQDDPVWDEAQIYAHRLIDAGVPVQVSSYPNVIHGFFLMAGRLDAGRKVIDEIGAHLKAAFAGEALGAS